MLMLLTVALALLPAASVAVPVTDWFAPLALRVLFGPQATIPEVASAQVKLTVTSVLFQLSAFVAGERLPLIVGGVASRLMVTDLESVPPALVAVQVSGMPAAGVSVEIIVWPHPEVEAIDD
jgi:hypothetical protein